MTVTSADVARHAGLSRATVSQVLNGHADRFAPETAARVMDAARELAYQPSTAGRMLRRGSSDFVVALVPNTTFGGNLQDLFEIATEILAERGLTLVLRLSTDSQASIDRIITGIRPRAVLSLQPFTDAERKVLTERGIPSFDTSSDRDLNRAIGRIQAEHLVQRGYRRLAFAHLQDERQDPYGTGREVGVREVCAEHGLPEPMVVGLGIDLEEADDALHLLGSGVGIAAYNDDVAISLLTAAQLRGWTVPGDVGLVGMDNSPLSRVTNPRLTTVGYDLPTVARNTVAAALTAIGDNTLNFSDIDLRLFPGDSA